MTLREHLEAIAGAPRARDGCLCGDCIVGRNQEHAVAALAILDAAERAATWLNGENVEELRLVPGPPVSP